MCTILCNRVYYIRVSKSKISFINYILVIVYVSFILKIVKNISDTNIPYQCDL